MINNIDRPVPYILTIDSKYIVVFVEPGSNVSTYEFNVLRDAKICANEVMPLVLAAVEEGLIEPEMVSDEEFKVEPIVTQEIDEYGFKTIKTEYYPFRIVIEIFDSEGNQVTPEQRQAYIDEIEAGNERQREKDAERLPAQVGYTAMMTDTELPDNEDIMNNALDDEGDEENE